MTCSVGFFAQIPIAVLFVTVGLGFLLGRLRLGPVSLGGVCGTLIVALLLGQTGCQVQGDLRDVAFALFIFAMGYSGGPQFFANLNRSSLRYIALPLIEAGAILAIVLASTHFLKLDPGTAAGLAAGAATESAVVGTAVDALKHLGLDGTQLQAMQANIATAYTLTYLVGLITIVFFASSVAPALLGIDLRRSSRELEQQLGVINELSEGGRPVLPRLVGRTHAVTTAAASSIASVEEILGGRSVVSRLFRGGTALPVTAETLLQRDDIVVIVAARQNAMRANTLIGPETPLPDGRDDELRLSRKAVIVNGRKMDGATLDELARRDAARQARGVFIESIHRMGHPLPVTATTTLQLGDVVTLVGHEPELTSAAARVGTGLRRTDATDLVFLCVGILAGLAIGVITIRIGGIPLSLGSGGGALVSGLVCGWVSAKRPGVGFIPEPATQLLKDVGLAIFVACVGLSAGPAAWTLIREHGAALPLVSVLVSLGPALLSLWVGHKLLKIPGPLLVGAIAGQHVSTPAISAILSASGSAAPLLGYTVTYAVANVLLPVMGPIIVALAHYVH